MKLSESLKDKGLLTYIGLYGLWGIGVNTAIKKTWTGGNWEKSQDTPFYWDNWSYTHLGWGAAAPFFGLSRGTFLVLNALNELVLERLLCELVNRGVGDIKFSAKCDPFPHLAADFIYSWLGFEVGQIAMRSIRASVQKNPAKP